MPVFHTVMPALRRMTAPVLAMFLLCACALAGSHDEFRPYDEKADANAQIAGLIAGNTARKRLLLTFGANWCSDSRALESHYQSPELAALLQREFLVLHVDVGTFHRNLDIAARYDNPIDKGIPSVVLLDPDGKMLYVNHGELSSAGSMSSAAIMKYFNRLATGDRAGTHGD